MDSKTITKSAFKDLLSKYPDLIKQISETKGTKPGQKTLLALDTFRYGDAPKRFGRDGGAEAMSLEDVKKLVEWKLRHGKFRPTLMGLVSANTPSQTETTIQSAITAYFSTSPSSSSTTTAIKSLSTLRGIGPATASLLLSVHDPKRAIFFSDEAFWWLCCGGKSGAPIKYNVKEYEMLTGEARVLCERLNVDAVDVERVAYVVMNKGLITEGSSLKNKESPAVGKKAAPKPSEKRKANTISETETRAGVRRSKRAKS